MNDEEVVRIALEVDHLRKQAEIVGLCFASSNLYNDLTNDLMFDQKLDTTGFGEKKEINKRKREILIYEVSQS